MNIVSTMVGLSVMGAAAPSMLQMSIAPFEAQKRAQNLGVAESTAVTYAAENEGAVTAAAPPSNCVKTENGSAVTVTCTEGEGKYQQSVTRAFRLQVPPACDNDGNNGHGNSGGYDCSNPSNRSSTRTFAYETPKKFSGHQCPTYDPWGVYGFNDQNAKALGGACKPAVLWTQTSYVLSDPSAWLYDVNNHNGWGYHSRYDDV